MKILKNSLHFQYKVLNNDYINEISYIIIFIDENTFEITLSSEAIEDIIGMGVYKIKNHIYQTKILFKNNKVLNIEDSIPRDECILM